MALLTGYSSTNKVVLNERKPIVNKILVWLNGYGFAWAVETVERQSFEYVGMTKAAADSCAADMVTAWTVQMTDYYLANGAFTSTTSNRLVADIAVVLQGGGMYKVTVDVNKVSNTIGALT